jgi:hypothetical protein
VASLTVARPVVKAQGHMVQLIGDGEDVVTCDWIDVLSSLATVTATVIALFLAWTAGRDQRRERDSGLAIVDVEPDATAFLANNTRVDLKFSLYRCEALIDPKTEVPSYRHLLSASSLNNKCWVPMKGGITLSPGERLPIHLTSLVVEETFVSLGRSQGGCRASNKVLGLQIRWQQGRG